MKKTLQELHAEILDAIAGLERIVEAPMPDTAALAAARLRLTRASGRRRRLLATLYPLLENGAPGTHERLRALRSEESASMQQSATHIARWSIAQIVANWAAYKVESATLRTAMRKRLAREKLVLYPLFTADHVSFSAAIPSGISMISRPDRRPETTLSRPG